MIELLDYVLDYEDNFWIVNSIEGNIPKGYMVYKVSCDGRYNPITKKKYVKMYSANIQEVPRYQKIFKLNQFYLTHKEKLDGVWKKYVNALNKIGIPDKDIGIFGSYLIGFEIEKDVDFVIYGIHNLKKYYKNVNFIRDFIGATSITENHIQRQYFKHKNMYHKNCDLLRIISRNWSGVQIKEGVLSTPRFIDRKFLKIPADNQKREVIRCKVLHGLTSALLPRRAEVIFENEKYMILTNLWKYQSFLEDGDEIECFASVNRKEKTIVLYDSDCYVKFLNIKKK